MEVPVRFVITITLMFVLALPVASLASASGPFPQIQVLGPGCDAAGEVPARGVLRVTFQNVAQSCAGGKCSNLVDAPLDASEIAVKHGDARLEGKFKPSGEKCSQHPVWAFDKTIPLQGGLTLSAKGAASMYVAIKDSVAGTMVLDYGDFGPQAAAHKLLGYQWWQWQAHGDSDPSTKYDVKVVIYRKVKLKFVDKSYAVVPEKHLDYRYVTYDAAMAYLDGAISENVLPDVTARLGATRDRLRSRFGAVESAPRK